MSNKHFKDVPLAIGEYVVLETFAIHPDNLEEKTESGIILKSVQKDFSQAIPKYAKIVSKGTAVPDSELNIGDYVVFPTGGVANNIEDPRVLNGLNVKQEEKRQFSYVHWKHIGASYIAK